MNPEQALSVLAQLCVEFMQQFANMPATREAVAMRAQEAVDTLRAAISAPLIRGGTDGNPPA